MELEKPFANALFITALIAILTLVSGALVDFSNFAGTVSAVLKGVYQKNEPALTHQFLGVYLLGLVSPVALIIAAAALITKRDRFVFVVLFTLVVIFLVMFNLVPIKMK